MVRRIRNELTEGIFNLLKGSSWIRAVVYTIGHIVIASLCNYFITGAPLDLAAVDAIVEPLINGVWYLILDWTFVNAKNRA